MDALRRAEIQEREPADTADNPEAPATETGALELAPLDLAPSEGTVQDTVPPAPGPEQLRVEQAPEATTPPEIERRVAAVAAAANSPSFLRSGFSYLLSAIVTVTAIVGTYYLWRSSRVIDASETFSETLVDIPQLPQPLATAAPAADIAGHTAPATPVAPAAPATVEDVAPPQPQPETDAPTPAAEPAAAAPAAARIEIRKSVKTRSVHPLLQQAYSAYREQDYGSAEHLYRQAARQHPGNRDALLGLAGIAMHQGDHRVARYYYETVLDHHPGDRVAQLALQSLVGSDDSLQESSRLKHWLQTDGDNAQLHFALGNRYAQDGQWKEAQAAYFEAARIDPDQPDYTFNLAVSLDQLGLHQQALDYYRKARLLAQRSGGLFSKAQLDRRIRKLEARYPEETP